MSNNRFLLVNQPSEVLDAAILLLEKNFKELPAAANSQSDIVAIIIDTTANTFFTASNKAVSECEHIIDDRFREIFHSINLKDISQWSNQKN